jgi:hypothetical protein
MRIEEILHVLKARRNGPKQWVATCPVHKERTPSLSIREGKKCVLLYCFGCHARADKIMPAVGLRHSDIFYESRGTMTPEQREAYRREQGRKEHVERLRREWIVAMCSTIAYPAEYRYWHLVAEDRLRAWEHYKRRMWTPEQRAHARGQFVADVLREAERKLDTMEIGSLAWHQQLKVARHWCEIFNAGYKQRTEPKI